MVCVFFYVKHETEWHRLQEKMLGTVLRAPSPTNDLWCDPSVLQEAHDTPSFSFFFSLKALKYICTSKQNEPSNSLVATLTQGSRKRHQIQYGSYRSTSIGTWSFTTAIRSRSHRNPKNKNRSWKGHQPACAYASIVIRGTLCKQCRGGFASWVWTVQKHSANTFFSFVFSVSCLAGRIDNTRQQQKQQKKHLLCQCLRQNKTGCHPAALKAAPKTQLQPIQIHLAQSLQQNFQTPKRKIPSLRLATAF